MGIAAALTARSRKKRFEWYSSDVTAATRRKLSAARARATLFPSKSTVLWSGDMRSIGLSGTLSLWFLMSLTGTMSASAQGLTTGALEGWLARYEQAWETRDAERAVALFSADARYHEMPFDAPKVGSAGIREYWTTVTADQRDIDFQSTVVAVNGQTGVARWSASLRSAASGARIALDGVFVLTFDASGRCSELREWWHVRSTP
jgi:ketosteroid isomerase-like protein